MDKLRYVFDRHPILSEHVYGQTLRNMNLLEETNYMEKLKEADPLIFICCPPLVVVKKNIQVNDQLEGVHQRITDLYQGYRELGDSLMTEGFQIYFYDYVRMDETKALTRVVRYLQNRPHLRAIPGGKSEH